MSFRRDGNGSRNSSSYKPYDITNSFVKRLTNRVTGLISWNTNPVTEVLSETDGRSSTGQSEDDELVSPAAKRNRVATEEENKLFQFIAKSKKNSVEICTPKKSAHDLLKSTSKPKNNKNFISSTPACSYPSDVSSSEPQSNYVSVSRDGDVVDCPERKLSTDEYSSKSSYYSTTEPLFSSSQKHNFTFSSISSTEKQGSSTMFNTTLTESSNTRNKSFLQSDMMLNKRDTSFNVDVFSSSNKRLSRSFRESSTASGGNSGNRCLSPFYSSRTMYGGASALTPYVNGGPTKLARVSSPAGASSAFAPRTVHQVEVRPQPSPTHADVTMSAVARRILDSLERYCSPVIDAKKIPINNKAANTKAERSQRDVSSSRAVKRKLPALMEIMPSTADLLRIKRQEKMQESVTNARLTAKCVPASTIAEDDGDSSDSTDLDYSLPIKKNDKVDNRSFVGKIYGKHKKNLDDTPTTAANLPDVALPPMETLPSFKLSDAFSFSTPVMGSDALQAEKSKPTVDTSVKTLPTKTVSFSTSVSVKPISSKKSELKQKPVSTSIEVPISEWLCQSCVSKNEPKCDSCIDMQNKLTKNKKVETTSSTVTAPPPANWGGLFKPATDTWTCSVCMVQNKLSTMKCVACETPKESVSSTDSCFSKIWNCNVCHTEQSGGTSCSACGMEKGESKTKEPLITFQNTPFKIKESPWSFGMPAVTTASADANNKVSSTSSAVENPAPLKSLSEVKQNGPSTESSLSNTGNVFRFGVDVKPIVSSSASNDSVNFTSMGQTLNKSAGENRMASSFFEKTVNFSSPSAFNTSVAKVSTSSSLPLNGNVTISPEAKPVLKLESASPKIQDNLQFGDVTVRSTSRDSLFESTLPKTYFTAPATLTPPTVCTTQQANSLTKEPVVSTIASSPSIFGQTMQPVPPKTTSSLFSTSLTSFPTTTQSTFAATTQSSFLAATKPTFPMTTQSLFSSTTQSTLGTTQSAIFPAANSFSPASQPMLTGLKMQATLNNNNTFVFGASAANAGNQVDMFNKPAEGANVFGQNKPFANGSQSIFGQNGPTPEPFKKVTFGDNVFNSALAAPPSSVTPNNAFGMAPSNGMMFRGIEKPVTSNVFGSSGFSFSSLPNNIIAKQIFPSSDVNQTPNMQNSSQPFMFNATAPTNQVPNHNFNTVVPSTFNFNAGNTISSFSAPPITMNSSAPMATRRIKKAIRRTTNK